MCRRSLLSKIALSLLFVTAALSAGNPFVQSASAQQQPAPDFAVVTLGTGSPPPLTSGFDPTLKSRTSSVWTSGHRAQPERAGTDFE
jgi:hypothetical protein